MKINDKLKKLTTGIVGLDQLFYGGIQLHWQFNVLDGTHQCDSEVNGDVGSNKEKHEASKSKPQGILIAIRGARGTNKTLLALQMVQGLTKSLYKSGFSKKYKPQFYSLNKSKEDVSDMYLDLLIERQIEKMITESISGISELRYDRKDFWNNDLLAKCLFRIEHSPVMHGNNETISLPEDYKVRIDKYLAKRIIYYNTRTNALHFKHCSDNDSMGNLLFYRKSDSVDDYFKNHYLDPLPENFRKDFIDVEFMGKNSTSKKEGGENNVYTKISTIRFQEIIDMLATPNEDNPKEKMVYPCVVIDGLSDISTDNLKTLPFTHIESTLRERAPISILIFDERYEDIKCNADIVIEMKRKEDLEEKYTYHELQIVKSVFQTVAFGWHQYKKRDAGIEVFPSLHRILQQRYYLTHLSLSTHSGILEESYGEYLKNMAYKHGTMEKYSYDKYESELVDRKMELLKEMYSHASQKSMEKDEDVCGYLDELLFGNSQSHSDRWVQHTYTTAIIGNPNSYKRVLANAKIFNAAKNQEHSLVLLFDKDVSDMLRHMVCPGFDENMPCKADIGHTKFYECSGCNLNCKLNRKCTKCYEYIHFFGVRMGCISAEELFAVLERQIEVQFKDGKKITHIIIDDLQKIDYSFPFLRKTPLFLSAMITFCRERNIELTILCDKKARLVNELCSLADNVLCMRRDDLKETLLYVERNVNNRTPSEIWEIKIPDMDKFFTCKSDNDFGVLKVDSNGPVKYEFKQIASMKEYWRKANNVYIKNEVVNPTETFENREEQE